MMRAYAIAATVLLSLLLPGPAYCGLVVRYAFSGNFADSSGNGYHGTAHGAPELVAGPAGFGMALCLDNDPLGPPTLPSQAQYVDCGPGPSSSLIGGSLTLSFWAKFDPGVSPGQQVILSNRGPGNFVEVINDSDAGRISVLIEGSSMSGPAATLSGGRPQTDGRWHHYAIAVDDISAGFRYRTYRDGRPVGVGANTTDIGSLHSTAPLWIGGAPGQDNFFSGMLDDVRIYNNTLSDAEIAALTIPEPASLVLLFCGALWLRRRRSL